MERVVIGLLAQRGLSLAVAESVTGGMVAMRLTAVPGASAVVRGAVVAYAKEVKHDVIGVPPRAVVSLGSGAGHGPPARRGASGPISGSRPPAWPVPNGRRATPRERCSSACTGKGRARPTRCGSRATGSGFGNTR